MANWTRRELLKNAGVGAAALMAPGLALGAPAPRRRPNILFILVDDMGWMDCGAYGSRYYETPNIDRLSRRGMLFTDAYAANPLCSPTRASIMTGKFPARLRFTTPGGHLPPLPDDHPLLPKEGPPHRKVLLPESRRHLPLEEFTLAEALKEAGYRTGFVGKWHLGQPEELWPPAQGFDVNMGGGGYPGPPDFFSPYKIKSLPDGPPGEYITDRLTDEALKFLETSRDQQPFFLCLWHYAVHSLWGHKPEITQAFLDKKDPRGKQANAVMASMLKSIDDGIGRVLAKLDELGLTENTIVVFTSDNGGLITSKIDMPHVPPPDGEGLPPVQRLRRDYYRVVGDMAPTNNEPLRGGKATVFEGGTRVPLVVSWPGAVKAGARTSELVSSIDFYPTLLAAAGAAPKPGQILDGESILPVLRGGKVKRDALFCHFPHTIGEYSPAGTWVRQGDWKLIRIYDTGERFPDEFELYNLREDLGETNNLAAKMPRKVKELDALISRHLKEIDAVVPIPNPAYDPDALVELQGWRPGGTCKLRRAEGVLRLESTGGDPMIVLPKAPTADGPLVARIRLRSESSGIAQFRWTDAPHPRFGPVACMDFQPKHDNQWQEIEVKFEVQGGLGQLRIDPCTAPGAVEFAWIRLSKPDGTVVHAWEFNQ